MNRSDVPRGTTSRRENGKGIMIAVVDSSWMPRFGKATADSGARR